MKKIKILDKNYIEEHNLQEINDYSYDLEKQLLENNIDYTIGYICADCGEFTEDCYCCYIEDKDYYVCEDCATNYNYCECCERWFSDDADMHNTENGDIICDECAGEYYIQCHDCGTYVHQNNVYYCEDCDEYFCYDCWNDHYHEDNLLYDYHAFRDWVPQQTEDEPTPPFYIGHELEIDDGDNMSEAVQEITTKLNGICMHDGSLSYRGIEFISHPLSYNYMLSRENDYRSVFQELINLGYKSHNTNTCGLHFHATRPENPDIIDRIILFMETYKEEIITLSRRNSGEISSWCNFLSDYKTDVAEKEIKSIDYIKKNKNTCNRYMALNLTNSRTIEFRIFKGTLKYETFMADFEFVNNLMTVASDLSIPVEEMTWTKVTSMGKFLPTYVEEHALKTDKPIVDYSTELLIERNRKLNKAKRELKMLYKTLLTKINSLTVNTKRFNMHELIDTNKLSNYIIWLEYVIRDLKLINQDNGYEFLNKVERTINDVKERMI